MISDQPLNDTLTVEVYDLT